MRLSVVDVGSNTVRLVVVDAEGGAPLPVHTAKYRLRLSQQVEQDGRLGPGSVEQVVEAVAAARAEAQRWGAAEPFVFATAVVRDAPNRPDILKAVREGAGVGLCVLPGEVEAEATFLAARRWMGFRSGPLAVLDIGGGSLEVAFGRGRLPDFAASLPLGAGRLTREHFAEQDPPPPAVIKSVRRQIRHQLRDVAARVRWEAPHTVVATSRTFQQLARLGGAVPGRQGPFAERQLTRATLKRDLKKLAQLTVAQRAQLPGISSARAGQSLAGALVAHTAMKLMSIEAVTICPWAIREGILLRHVEDGGAWWDQAAFPNADSAPRGVTLRLATPGSRPERERRRSGAADEGGASRAQAGPCR